MKRLLKKLGLGILVIVILCVSFFFVVRKLDKDALNAPGFYPPVSNVAKATLLPSLFINGERFYIKAAAANGDTLLAFGDTGGGISMMFPATLDKLGVVAKVRRALLKGAMPVKYVLFDDIVTDKAIPGPVPLRSKILRHPLSRVSEPLLFIPPMDDELKFISQCMPIDIFLGQNFFMRHAWTIDYPHRQIWVNTPLPASEEGRPGVQKLGFKKNSNHESAYGHPSMFIEVDGEIIEVLFDTGATIVLSEEGKKAFNTSEKTIGGSFIAASIFDKWRKAHPGWKYYAKTDMNRDVIEVPSVKIGAQEVGPVLFAKRPDEVWSAGMIETMDKVVKGAIGGSALKYLKVTIDYNSELAKFEK